MREDEMLLWLLLLQLQRQKEEFESEKQIFQMQLKAYESDFKTERLAIIYINTPSHHNFSPFNIQIMGVGWGEIWETRPPPKFWDPKFWQQKGPS